MADTKITALTALTAADPINDVIPIVDVSDTSMAASGTTKKISVNNILGASGTATLASATITGALDAARLNVTGATIPANGVYLGSANNLSFSAASALGMTLNSTGLGIGGSPANGIKLSSFVTSDGAPATSGTTQASGSLRIGAVSTAGAMDMGTAGTYSWIQVLDRTNLATNYNLVLNPNGGNVGIGVTPAGTGGCLQLKSGITFPATQVASSDANTLDDYEEGTFTPAIVGSTTAGTGTYTGRSGKYTKVGNLVTFQVFIDWSAHTGTGDMRIGNLPFTNSSNFYAASVGYANNIALTAGNILTGYVDASAAYVTLSQTPTGGGTATNVPIDTAAVIVLSGLYTV